MKILVTGGCGFIGHSLTKRLLEEGHEVYIVDNHYIGRESKIAEGAKFVGGDVRAMENIVDKPYDWIYHLAAFSRVGLSYQNQNYTFSTNVDGTKSVLEYAKRNGCKVIFASSSSVHHSISPYSTSKRMGEELCRFYRDGLGVDTTIVRLYNVYGPGELVESHMAALIGKWRNQINNNLPITFHSVGTHLKPFTHIDDVVNGLIKLIKTKEVNLSGWELGNTTSYSVHQVYKMFEERFPNIKVEKIVDVLGAYSMSRRKNDEVIRLGWFPKDRLKEYINSL